LFISVNFTSFSSNGFNSSSRYVVSPNGRLSEEDLKGIIQTNLGTFLDFVKICPILYSDPELKIFQIVIRQSESEVFMELTMGFL
jgi:hypothetical protein